MAKKRTRSIFDFGPTPATRRREARAADTTAARLNEAWDGDGETVSVKNDNFIDRIRMILGI